ncbi:MAG: PHP domain-containing protein [Kiritimatiellia bacterium]|jgi:PHP family Zn ribbon phosphoesterase
MRFDLHIHSCLSPCADLEMAPSAIARAARERGLHGIAIADHNSARNAKAFAVSCAREGVAPLFGLEVCTAEEVHMLTLFDTVEQAMDMTAWVYDALVKRVNQPEIFGDQPVVDADDNIEELEWRMLGFATRRSVYDVGAQAHALGGLVVASHVDRPSFSAFSQLGVLSGQEGFDAMELSRTADEARWRERIGAHPLVRSSDAHLLDDIGLVWTEADLAAFTVAELRRAFHDRATTLSPRLKSF